MERWNVRVIIYKRDGTFEAECLEAAAVGVGDTPLEAMDDLIAMLSTMITFAYKNGATFTIAVDDGDEQLFARLEKTSGESDTDVAAFGRFTITHKVHDHADEARLEKMDLVSGVA